MPQLTESPLSCFTDKMNELLPAYDVAGDPQVPAEARQNLLRDARSVRDMYMQDRTRKENQLLAAQQTVVTLTAELRIADEKLITIEDIVGEVRARMNKRGLATHPIARRPLSIVPTPASTVTSPQQPPPSFSDMPAPTNTNCAMNSQELPQSPAVPAPANTNDFTSSQHLDSSPAAW